jgi:integrase
MSVFFNPTKQRWQIELTRDGKRHTKIAPKGATKAEAEAYEAQVKLGIWQGQLGKKQERTLDEALTRWVKEELPKRRSQEKVISHATHIAPYCKGRMLSEAPQVANEYANANRHLSAASIYQRLSILRRVCNLAFKKWDWIDQPIGQKIQMPTIRNERHVYITKDELDRILQHAKQQWLKDAILIGIYTGMRQGNVVSLKPEDVRGDLLYIQDEKTQRPRAVPVHPTIEDALTRLPFPVTKWAVSHAFTKLVRDMGYTDLHFHDLRHSCASWLVQAGESLYTVGAVLGHSSVATTKRYAHLSIDNLRTAIKKMA